MKGIKQEETNENFKISLELQSYYKFEFNKYFKLKG